MTENNNCSSNCCQEAKKRTPADLTNSPGLSALKYRVGTHCQFKADMIEAIPHMSALKNLTTREDDDLAIALIDGWAIIADVLSFYQERIINEGYIRTATERMSVLELARAIGYELKPGVAASANLAFMVEDAPGAPVESVVAEGTKVMSVPGQNEKLQIFETVESLVAKAELNIVKPLQMAPSKMVRGRTGLYLKGINTRLAPGDAILLVGAERLANAGSEQWDLRILLTVTPDKEKDYTYVTWKESLGHDKPIIEPSKKPKVYAFRMRASIFGYNAPDFKAMPDSIKVVYNPQADANGKPVYASEWKDFDNIVKANNSIYLDAVYPKIVEGSWIVLSQYNYVELYNATKVIVESCTYFTLSAKTTGIQLDTNEHLNIFRRRDTVVYAVSEELELNDEPLTEPVYRNLITLDRVVPDLKKNQKIIVSGRQMQVQVLQKKNMTVTPADGLKEKDILYVTAPPTTNVDGVVTWALQNQKGVAVSVVVNPVNIVPKSGKITIKTSNMRFIAIDDRDSKVLPIGATLTLQYSLPFIDGFGNLKWLGTDGTVVGYVIDPSDRIVAMSPNEKNPIISEVVSIEDLSDDSGTTVITLVIPEGKTFALSNVYELTSVNIYANIALATHGETVNEILGSGDGSQINQQFSLRKPPLTYISASTPSGGKSTLKVYVNDVQWQEVASFYGLVPSDQSYTVRIEDDGGTEIYFGDGKSAARLPSGSENIKAIYRSGIGLAGAVTANKLTLLQKRPFGIKSVTNPMDASGAASPENIEDARVNAPSTVLTLGRIVALKDYEDFARTFSGIGKANASADWSGEEYIVHLIVASSDAKEVDAASVLYQNLLNAINSVRAYGHKISLESFAPIYFNILGKVYIAPAYLPDEVMANVLTALQNAFTFEKGSFGQNVASSDVIAVIQEVPGVLYTDIDRIYVMNQGQPDLTSFTVEPQMLLMVNPDGINLEGIQ